jgi:NAD+ synthase (glutamine-hydrolysing)
MKNRMIKVGAAVPQLRVADINFNSEAIITVIREAKGYGLVVFPELCITGYTCADLFTQSALIDAARDALIRIAHATAMKKGTTFVIGLPLRYENCLYNCAAFLCEGAIAGIVPKISLPTYSEYYESRWFKSGRDVIGREIVIGGESIPFGIDKKGK